MTVDGRVTSVPVALISEGDDRKCVEVRYLVQWGKRELLPRGDRKHLL